MENNNKNFNSAQRSYDNMMPESYSYFKCESCEGEGKILTHKGLDEYDICPDCKGAGEIELSQSELKKLQKEKQDQRDIEDYEDDKFYDGTSWLD